MKKIVVFIALISIGFFLGNQYSNQKSKRNELTIEKKLSEISKERDKYKIALDEIKQEDDVKEVSKTNEDREDILRDFSYKLLNFTSIDDRNDEIKSYLTNKCIKEQGLDVKVNADFNSIGSIEYIYQETDDVNHYIVLGNDKSRGAEHDVLIDITFEKDKINSFSIKYMELR
ncbi:TPA: EF0163 family protein [Enterococcus faecium]